MINQSLASPVEILLIEDNPGDIRLIEEALRNNDIFDKLNVVTDGVAALEFLRREGKYADAVRPGLILLDLNLPRKDGRELLAEVKADQRLKSIPVVVLTTSKAEQDLIETYKNHANCYVSKPLDLDQFIKAVKSIRDFWLRTVRLPPPTG